VAWAFSSALIRTAGSTLFTTDLLNTASNAPMAMATTTIKTMTSNRVNPPCPFARWDSRFSKDMSVGITGCRHRHRDTLATLADRNQRRNGMPQMVVVDTVCAERNTAIDSQWVLRTGSINTFATGKVAVAINV